MLTVIETMAFIRAAASLFSEDERFDLIAYLAANPFAGDEIRGTGGVRKYASPSAVAVRAVGRG